jgi:hypothetical protein
MAHFPTGKREFRVIYRSGGKFCSWDVFLDYFQSTEKMSAVNSHPAHRQIPPRLVEESAGGLDPIIRKTDGPTRRWPDGVPKKGKDA